MFGLSFLNSFFLWGLTAASIPIIIHLIKRNRAVKLPFAAMRFLQLEPNERYKSQRLKQLLLLLMRIAAFVLLALAFARPFMKNMQRKLIWSDERQAAVILIDNSYSMSFADDFELAMGKAKELLASFTAGDKVTVMAFSDKTETVFSGEDNFQSMASQLPQHITLSGRSTDFSQALQSAEAVLLESPFQRRVLYVISDFQKSGWANLYPGRKLQPGIKLNFIRVEPEGFANVAIKDVAVAHENRSGMRGDVLVNVLNATNEKQQVNVRVYINKKKSAEQDAQIEPYAENVVALKNVRFPGRMATGYVEVRAKNDGISMDNRYYFNRRNNNHVQILAIDGEPSEKDNEGSELFFLQRAMNLQELTKFQLKSTTRKNIDGVDFNDYRAVILANVKDLSRESIRRLDSFVRNGGGLVVALGDQIKPNIFNSLFRDLSPARLQNPAFTSVDREQGVVLAGIDYRHPIFRLFSDAGQSDPGNALFFQYFICKPVSANAVLASFDDGSPALLERKVDLGKVILFTSSIDTEWDNLPVTGLFLPLLYQIMDYVIAQKKVQNSYLVGSPIPMGDEHSNVVVKPEGKQVSVTSELFYETDVSGIYAVKRKQGSKPLRYFAVNVNAAAESNVVATTEKELDETLHSLTTDGIQTASVNSMSMVENQEKSQNLWRVFLLAVLLLLLGETWLANRTYR